ncbi:MAG: hypothetical protein AAF569_08355 [Pseudomonadota bacterium]
MILFGQSEWLLPLCLVVWSFLCLFRLFLLTTPFEVQKNSALPYRILASLGFKKQEEREDVLGRIFLDPFFILFLVLGTFYLAVEFFQSSAFLNDHLIAVFWGSRAALNVESGSLFLTLQPLFFPFLCGLMFALFSSYGLNKKVNHSVSLCFMALFVILLFILGWSPAQETMSGYMQRASMGGFWMASLPYILGFLILSISSKAVFDGFLNQWLNLLCSASLLLSMAFVDMNHALSQQSQAILLNGWVILGLLNGPVIYETQTQYDIYRAFKEKLDFGTKIEHS